MGYFGSFGSNLEHKHVGEKYPKKAQDKIDERDFKGALIEQVIEGHRMFVPYFAFFDINPYLLITNGWGQGL
jgi:hypothetical protein